MGELPEGRKVIMTDGASERIYPCADCGTMRSKDEGGTVFTVCDTCWDKHYHPVKTDGAKLIEDTAEEICRNCRDRDCDDQMYCDYCYDLAKQILSGLDVYMKSPRVGSEVYIHISEIIKEVDNG